MEIEDFAPRLTELREKAGVSAREMSLDMGQNPGYINNIESGKSLPSWPGIVYICKYLGISESAFFDLNSSDPAELQAIVEDLKRLDDAHLEMIAKLVRDLIKA